LPVSNNRNGTSSEVGLKSGVALNIDGMEQAGMGLGIGDHNLHGNVEIFKTHSADDTSILYRNDGEGFFDDVTDSCGFGTETRYIGGVLASSISTRPLPDLFAVTGGLSPEIQPKLPNYPLRTPCTLFRNLGAGRFEELMDTAGPGISALHRSRGCAFGDFDNDGDLDVLVINLNQPPSFLRNDVRGTNYWLKVKLIGSKSNRPAIGSRVIAHYGDRRQAPHARNRIRFMFWKRNERRAGDLGFTDPIESHSVSRKRARAFNLTSGSFSCKGCNGRSALKLHARSRVTSPLEPPSTSAPEVDWLL
jgi:hypothetical protein